MSRIGEWLQFILPSGDGNLLMYGLYADESYITKDGDFVVAGYLLGSKRLPEFVQRWSDALGSLEYFHMSEGHHKRYPEIYERLLDLISPEYFVAGFYAGVNQADYRKITNKKWYGQPLRYWFGGHYSFCATAIAENANRWMNSNNPSEKDLAYIFEAGNQKQGEADWAFNKINSDPLLADWKRRIRYYSHSFVDGKRRDSGHLQAADMLAWHLTNTSHYRRAAPDNVRKKLLSVPTYGVYYPADKIVANMNNHVDFVKFYGSIKRAVKLRRL